MPCICVSACYRQLYKLNLGASLFYGLDFVASYAYLLVQLWKTLVVGKDETAKSLVFIRFGQAQVEHLVYALNFEAAREDLFVVAQ